MIEAARSMGAGNIRIIVKVLIVEARTSLITGMTIAIGTILGYSAMAGTVGGGGLGDIAIRYGYYRYDTNVMFITVYAKENYGWFIYLPEDFYEEKEDDKDEEMEEV